MWPVRGLELTEATIKVHGGTHGSFPSPNMGDKNPETMWHSQGVQLKYEFKIGSMLGLRSGEGIVYRQWRGNGCECPCSEYHNLSK